MKHDEDEDQADQLAFVDPGNEVEEVKSIESLVRSVLSSSSQCT